MRKTHPEVIRSKPPAPKLSISKPMDGSTKKHNNTPAKPGNSIIIIIVTHKHVVHINKGPVLTEKAITLDEGLENPMLN